MFNLDDYETVAERVMRLKTQYPDARILSDIVSLDHTKGEVLAKALIFRTSERDEVPAAIDFAFGIASTYPVSMRKFYVEDTLTSAIGRAISLVIPTDKKPTREDMQKVEMHNKTHDLIEKTRDKLKEASGEYVPVANPADPWTIVPSKQGQTIGEAIDVLTDSGFAAPVVPERICKCNRPMAWKTGEKKTGGLWGALNCTLVPSRRCTPSVIWFNLVNGEWVEQTK